MTPGSEPPPATARTFLARPSTRVALAVLAAVAAAAGVWYGFFRTGSVGPPPEGAQPAPDPPPPDPRLTFPTPFRNVRPDVPYVGDAACAPCHQDIDRSYHAHPMGRSAAFTAKAAPVERYDTAPVTAGAYRLWAEKAGGVVRHHVAAADPSGGALPESVMTADVAIGSGVQGRSYLSVEGGWVWQTPISWFSRDARWGLSPGLEPTARREIVADCLFCHTDRVDPVPGAVNRYKEPLFPGQVSIGCERCHGPGGLHAANPGRGPDGIDPTVVNPKHLAPDLRADVCRPCHLLGEDRVPRRGRSPFEFRPGLPWELFEAVFVGHPAAADPHRSVSQFEQMEQSRCFAGSGGRLGCTSCHDPHAKPAPAEAERFYRGRCLSCHESKGCSLPAAERTAKNDNCVACHMPRGDSSTIAHTAVTDHRVPRRPAAAAAPGRPPPDALPVVPFRAGPHAPPQVEQDRDYGIALAKRLGRTGPAERDTVLAAEGRLRAALKTWPGDADAWGALASVRAARGELAGALEAARRGAELAPQSEERLEQFATVAVAAGDLDLAARTADRLVELNPRSLDHRLTQAVAAMRRGRWAEAEAACRAALALHPIDPVVRLHLAVCRHQQGDPAGGRRELDVAIRLAPRPQDRAAFAAWYRRQTR